jgi:hypothetical protein
LLNGLAVGEKFDGVHTPLATLAARHEEGGFLHAFGDFTLVDARVLAGLTEKAQKGIVLRGKNGLGNGGSSSPAQRRASGRSIIIIFRLSKIDNRDLYCARQLSFLDNFLPPDQFVSLTSPAMTYLSARNIHLLLLSPALPAVTLLDSFPSRDIVVADFAVEGAAQMTGALWGYR